MATASARSAANVAGVLNGWSTPGRPLYRGLAIALREAIERRDLAPGICLPPERVLADALAVSRSTVVGAYEVLKDEGLVDGRQGSGTYIAKPNETMAPADGDGLPAAEANAVFRRLIDRPTVDLDLTAAAMPALPAVSRAVSKILETGVTSATATNGYVPQGLPALREAIAQHLTDGGLPTSPRNLLVTTGAQQALALLAQLYLNPGDAVAVENPTYPGALDAFRGAHARLLPFAVGTDGDHIEAVMAGGQPRLLYTIPTYNNPTGVVMPSADRERLAALSASRQIPVIEDTVMADLDLTAAPRPPHLASFASAAPIITIGSASKMFWGGFRVGWVRASENLIARLTRTKTVADLGGSLISQLIVAGLLENSVEILDATRRELRGRLATLTDRMEALLPTWRWRSPEGGLALWAQLPHGDSEEFAQVALRHGVAVLPGRCLSVTEEHTDFVRLALVLPEAALGEAVRRLAAAWAGYVPGKLSRDSLPPPVI